MLQFCPLVAHSCHDGSARRMVPPNPSTASSTAPPPHSKASECRVSTLGVVAPFVPDSHGIGRFHGLSSSSRQTKGVSFLEQLKDSPPGASQRRMLKRHVMFCLGSISSRNEMTPQEEEVGITKEQQQQQTVTEEFMETQFVHWFREGSPYIQGHRSSTFVIVIPGEVTVDNAKMDGILQDILLLHGLGVKLVIIPGTRVQTDQLLIERGIDEAPRPSAVVMWMDGIIISTFDECGHHPRYSGAYRITDGDALAAAMEAAGRVRLAIEAKLSRSPSIPILRRHGDTDRWHEVSIASGNFLAAKRRGVVKGIDFGATGEVKRIDINRVRERLASNCIVMLSNLGYSTAGEVLNCNIYEVATACAIALQADKLLCLLTGPVLDDDNRLIRFMTLQEADKLIRGSADQSSAAADYANSVMNPSDVQMPSLYTRGKGGDYANGTAAITESSKNPETDRIAPGSGLLQKASVAGFAIRGDERPNRYMSELTAAVFVCRNGVRRVHLLNSNVQGVLLLELYTRDGIGTMVSSDMYEGTRPANYGDIPPIMDLLKPLEESGVLVNRPREQLVRDYQNYIVVERDGSIIACAELIPYHDDKCGEVAAFAVSAECRGRGQGDALLDYIERRAQAMKLERLFLLTTRTADWFVHRGFSGCTVDHIPQARQNKIDYKRGAKYYDKPLDRRPIYRSPRR